MVDRIDTVGGPGDVDWLHCDFNELLNQHKKLKGFVGCFSNFQPIAQLVAQYSVTTHHASASH